MQFAKALSIVRHHSLNNLLGDSSTTKLQSASVVKHHSLNNLLRDSSTTELQSAIFIQLKAQLQAGGEHGCGIATQEDGGALASAA